MGHGRDNGLEGQDGAGGLQDLGLQFDLEEHVYVASQENVACRTGVNQRAGA